VAQLETSAKDGTLWSQPLGLNFKYDEDEAEAPIVRKSKQKWASRALGEHASVASFAAFTIGLMTHAAPPQLVDQALDAARDEVRHARLSFAQAGGEVGPTALPPTEWKFQHDPISLAVSVAQEGCLEEMGAALQLARDAAAASNDKEQNLLKSIALDEARHAGLAWRTVRWVCAKDPEACERSKARILSSHLLLNEDTALDTIDRELIKLLLEWLDSDDSRLFCQERMLLPSKIVHTESSIPFHVSMAIQFDVCEEAMPPEETSMDLE
jgi:hypothetical protein